MLRSASRIGDIDMHSASVECCLGSLIKTDLLQQFSLLEFCFQSLLADRCVARPLLPLKPAGQRLVC